MTISFPDIVITKENVLFCRRKVAQYLEEARQYEAKAETCKPSQRGAYRSHAAQARKIALSMQGNEAAQMSWLAENNPPLWKELVDREA